MEGLFKIKVGAFVPKHLEIPFVNPVREFKRFSIIESAEIVRCSIRVLPMHRHAMRIKEVLQPRILSACIKIKTQHIASLQKPQYSRLRDEMWTSVPVGNPVQEFYDVFERSAAAKNVERDLGIAVWWIEYIEIG